MSSQTKPICCDGWRRYGGAFTLGPPRYEQCGNDATVMLKLTQKGKTQTLLSCAVCWQEAIDNKMPIIEMAPVINPK